MPGITGFRESKMEKLFRKTVIAAGISGVVYLLLFFFFDKPVDLWVHHTCVNTEIFRLAASISCMAKGVYVMLAIAVCFIMIIAIDPDLKKEKTRNLLYICVSCSIAIIIGEGLKFLLARARPIMLFEHNLYGLTFFSSKWALNSTPSGHTFRAFSILTALSLLYRRGTVAFISVAILMGASRVFVTAHYPSDILFGAFIGIFTAAWVYRYFLIRTDK